MHLIYTAPDPPSSYIPQSPTVLSPLCEHNWEQVQDCTPQFLTSHLCTTACEDHDWFPNGVVKACSANCMEPCHICWSRHLKAPGILLSQLITFVSFDWQIIPVCNDEFQEILVILLAAGIRGSVWPGWNGINTVLQEWEAYCGAGTSRPQCCEHYILLYCHEFSWLTKFGTMCRVCGWQRCHRPGWNCYWGSMQVWQNPLYQRSGVG